MNGFYTKTKNGNIAHVLADENVSNETMIAIEKLIDLAYLKIKTMNKNALWLVAEGEYVILKIEVNGKWIELIKERLDAPFSHIIEPAGIEKAIK